MKGVAATTAVAAAVAGASGAAQADSYREGASRYIPPGQWSYHQALEWWEFPSEDPEVIEVWGYTDKLSYKPGEDVAFHVNTGAPTFDIKIYRDGGTFEEVHAATGVAGKRSSTPKDAYTVGCGWPALYTWKLPTDLRSGFYLVVFSIKRGEETIEQEAGFCVRPTSRKSSMALILCTATWAAYNDWAGGSYYGKPGVASGATGSAEGDILIVPRVHLHRPWARGFMRLPNSAARMTQPAYPVRPKGHVIRYFHNEYQLANGYSRWSAAAGWASFDRLFAIWAERNGYEFDYITQHDIQADPDILQGYTCTVLAGHDEYWSWDMRKSLDNWIEAGGHLARFAANMLWQVRYEDNDLVQVCYKGFARNHDPFASDPAKHRLVTDAWEDIKFAKWPSAQTFGSSTAFGHLVGLGGASPRTAGFTVYRSDHWMLADTDLYYGDSFGADYVRFECDGVPYTFRSGLPYPTDEFGTPTNIEIVAMFPTLNGEESRDHSPHTIASNDGYLYGYTENHFGVPPSQATPEQKEKVKRGCGIVAYMPKGKGDVATTATCEWVNGLGKDEFVDQITHNVLKRFTA